VCVCMFEKSQECQICNKSMYFGYDFLVTHKACQCVFHAQCLQNNLFNGFKTCPQCHKRNVVWFLHASDKVFDVFHTVVV
jgi:hypothetical protein